MRRWQVRGSGVGRSGHDDIQLRQTLSRYNESLDKYTKVCDGCNYDLLNTCILSYLLLHFAAVGLLCHYHNVPQLCSLTAQTSPITIPPPPPPPLNAPAPLLLLSTLLLPNTPLSNAHHQFFNTCSPTSQFFSSSGSLPCTLTPSAPSSIS